MRLASRREASGLRQTFIRKNLSTAKKASFVAAGIVAVLALMRIGIRRTR